MLQTLQLVIEHKT